jgi:hypothetical protein
MFYLQIWPIFPRCIFGCLEQQCFGFFYRTRENTIN